MDSIKQKGFTVTELLIAAVVGGMLAATVFAITIFMFSGVIRNNVRAELTMESQAILRVVVDELRIGSGVRTANSIADVNEPVGGWTTSNADLILIIAMPAQDLNQNFIIDPLTGDPYQNEYIYYADATNNTLYKRILANPSATGNSVTTTCPPELATDSCPADRLLSNNFENMSFVFYDQDDQVTNDPLLARSVEIDIDMTKRSFGQDINIENLIRITLRNKLS